LVKDADVKPPLQFYVMVSTYNIYDGGHPTLSLIPDFLLADAPFFGAAITELTVTFHFASSGPPGTTLGHLYARFHADREKLPKVVFRRSRETMAIDVASNLIDGSDPDADRSVSLPLFRSAVAETIEALRMMKLRLTKKDDFNLAAFIAHCLRCKEKIPSDEESLASLAAELEDREATIKAAMTPWERLGIDWRDYHPDARRILDDPFYWEQANDYAPHGNDTGADLLSAYRTWLERQPSGNPLDFFKSLMARWEFSLDSNDPIIRSALDEAAVGLAFAEFKLRGTVTPAVATLAREAVHRQRRQALTTFPPLYREDRIRSLELIAAKLPQVD
jgi:uncharacterized protein YfeS